MEVTAIRFLCSWRRYSGIHYSPPFSGDFLDRTRLLPFESVKIPFACYYISQMLLTSGRGAVRPSLQTKDIKTMFIIT
jgi:hypothetical protein